MPFIRVKKLVSITSVLRVVFLNNAFQILSNVFSILIFLHSVNIENYIDWVFSVKLALYSSHKPSSHTVFSFPCITGFDWVIFCWRYLNRSLWERLAFCKFFFLLNVCQALVSRVCCPHKWVQSILFKSIC